MCHNNMVVTVVNGFVKKGFMFTAFDVTKFLRASGSTVRHSDINSAVKHMFNDGEMNDYLRDVKDVGAPVAPFVYYHQNADLDNYITDWLENNPDQDGMKNDGDIDDGSGIVQPTASSYGTTATKAPVSVAKATPTKTTLPKGVKSTDKEGRLYIAPVVTQSAGLHPKQVVWVVTDNSKLVITTNSAAKGSWPYSVNSDGRIRICRSVLDRIPKGNGYKVSASTGNIEVVSV